MLVYRVENSSKKGPYSGTPDGGVAHPNCSYRPGLLAISDKYNLAPAQRVFYICGCESIPQLHTWFNDNPVNFPRLMNRGYHVVECKINKRYTYSDGYQIIMRKDKVERLRTLEWDEFFNAVREEDGEIIDWWSMSNKQLSEHGISPSEIKEFRDS